MTKSSKNTEPSIEKQNIVDKLFELEEKTSNHDIQKIIDEHIADVIHDSNLSETFNILLLFDDESILRATSDKIYKSLIEFDLEKPTLLLLNTPGGDVAAAYLISKLCREHTNKNFEVAVPRRAKSAGTLICCGADKIHMGSLSELGPIDPQLGNIPALAFKNSVEHLAKLVEQYPASSRMFSDYLAKALNVESIGYFERVAESAKQYAERLLDARLIKSLDKHNTSIAHHLVYEYKDHGFVIASREAKKIFGDLIIDCNTDEYKFANTIYEELNFIGIICNSKFSKNFTYVGNSKNGSNLTDIKQT